MEYFTIENTDLVTPFTLPPNTGNSQIIICFLGVDFHNDKNDSPNNFKTRADFEDASMFPKFFVGGLSSATSNFYPSDRVNSG